jgi:diguanylate cyclase (GGDEF)-like protein
MPGTLAGIVELGVVAGSLASASAAVVVMQRTRAAVRADRIALRLARTRDAAFVDAARRLAAAARGSVEAVRDEIARAAPAIAPRLDGVLFYEEHDGGLRCVVATGERFAYFAGSCVAFDDARALPARALQAGHRVTLADAGVARLHPADVAALGVPLALDARRACVLVFAAPVALEDEEMERLVTLADQASPAYLIALDREHDRRDAEYDGLTGLLTPRAFRRRLAGLVERIRFVPGARLALLFVDTDNFKRWNDRFGHAAGDALLRDLASVLRTAAPSPCDLVARNGGDEFCIVFTETDKSTAVERAGALRRRVAALDLRGLAISASIGVAAYPADACDPSALLERADAAMYHAKQTGRDGVSYCDGAGYTRLVQQASSERPVSSLVSAFPTIL